MRKVLGRKPGAAGLVLGLALIVVPGIAALQALAAPHFPAEPTERIMLRVPDLPPGYVNPIREDEAFDFVCEELDPSEPGARLRRFVARFDPRGCIAGYSRLFRIPGAGAAPALVGSGAMDTGSDVAAATGFALAPQLLGNLTEEGPPPEVPATEPVGEATRLFHWSHFPGLLGSGRFASFLVWRSGTVLAAVMATGRPEVADRAAAELARKQQAHVESPTPYTADERDTTEVPLDNPAVKVPVLWLGRTFAPGHGLPAARLQSAFAAPGAAHGQAGSKVTLEYSRRLFLHSWTPAGWRRFSHTGLGRRWRTWRCTEKTRLALPGGSATVFAAYRRDFRDCPDRPPSYFFAIARTGGTVTAANFATCRFCPELLLGGPYNSLGAMDAIVRSLRVRPKPDF